MKSRKKIIKLQFWVTLSNISQIFWPISISRMSSGLFLSSDKKNPRGPEKRYGALNVSCSEVCPQFSVDLRLFCLRCQRPFAFPLSMSPYGRKSDKNWPTGSKNKNLSFSKINLVRFWRALKRQVFDKKRHFFDIFGFPPTGYFTSVETNIFFQPNQISNIIHSFKIDWIEYWILFR